MFTLFKAFIIRTVVIPTLLLFTAFVLSIIYYISLDKRPNVLSQNEVPKNFRHTEDFFRGEIKPDENYFGILQVNFEKKNLTNQNSIFRIKEVSDKNWRHTSIINADFYYYTPIYRFGFPTIEDSKNKTYVFEIFLLNESGHPKGGSLAMNKDVPYVTLQYDYKKSLLLSDPVLIGAFVKGKIVFYMKSEEYWNVFAVYSMPLVFYIFYLFNLHELAAIDLRRRIGKNLAIISRPYLATLLGAIAVDAFALHLYSDLFVAVSILLWILGISTYRLKPKSSFYVGLGLLLFCSITVFSHMDPVAEKLAVFAYIFLVIGAVHAAIEVIPAPPDKDSNRVPNSLIRTLSSFPILFDRRSTSVMRVISGNISNAFNSLLLAIYTRRPSSPTGWTIAVIKTIVLLIIFATLSFLGIKELIKINRKTEIENRIKQRNSMNPQIDSIEPFLVYKATNIVLYGREFGWNVDGQERIYVDGKPAVTDLWTDNEIVFAVPLDWKLGVHKVWIEKPISWNNQNIVAKSRTVTFTILPITNGFTKSDRLYFEQLEKLKKTTLNLNGYN